MTIKYDSSIKNRIHNYFSLDFEDRKELIGDILNPNLSDPPNKNKIYLFEAFSKYLSKHISNSILIGDILSDIVFGICENGHLKVFKYLVSSLKNKKKDFKFVRTDDEGNTIFLSALSSGNLELVKYIVDNQLMDTLFGDVNYENQTSYHKAVMSENLEVVKYLEDLYVKEQKKYSLGNISQYEYLELPLTDPKSIVYQPDSSDSSPYFYANLEISKYMESKYQINFKLKTVDSEDVYLMAAYLGYVDKMNYLEDKHNWDINSVNSDGDNAYIMASFSGKVEVLKHLDSKYEDHHIVKFKNFDGDDAIYECFNADQLEVYKYFDERCDKGEHDIFDDFRKNQDYDFFPQIACELGALNILKHLNYQGYQNNATDDCDDYLTHIAVTNNHLHILKYLLEERGFSTELINEFGDDILLTAIKLDDLDIVKYLIGHDPFQKYKLFKKKIYINKYQNDDEIFPYIINVKSLNMLEYILKIHSRLLKKILSKRSELTKPKNRVSQGKYNKEYFKINYSEDADRKKYNKTHYTAHNILKFIKNFDVIISISKHVIWEKWV